MSVRVDLAEAASALEGVVVYPYFRQTTAPGSGFVRVESIDRDDSGFGFMVTWQVAVVLPQDLANADRWVEERVVDLIAALEPEGAVMGAQPVQLNLDGPTVPALIVTVIRAQE